jgi:hypothetical protein
MRLSWGQTVAGGLTLAVVAGLLLLPGRLLGPDRTVELSVSATHAPVSSVQAVPPLGVHHRRPHRPKPAKVSAPTQAATRLTYVARPRTVVRVSPARTMLKAHRSAVISKLAPTAPLVRARVLATLSVRRPNAKPKSKPKSGSSTAKTIAALAASLSKN